jgi:hypothetical protein
MVSRVPLVLLDSFAVPPSWSLSAPPAFLRSCVRQVQQLVMVRVVRFIQVNKQHPFVRSETTIPSSRPAFRQSAARSGSQGCRRERGGTGGAGAKRP